MKLCRLGQAGSSEFQRRNAAVDPPACRVIGLQARQSLRVPPRA
jgi:hypothetical protein